MEPVMTFDDFEPYEVLSSIESLWIEYRSTREMHQCPYLNGTGARKCLSGCGSGPEPEPHCITDCPDGEGWGPQLHRLELLIGRDLEEIGPEAGPCMHFDQYGHVTKMYHPGAPQGLSFCHGCRRVVIRGKGRWWR